MLAFFGLEAQPFCPHLNLVKPSQGRSPSRHMRGTADQKVVLGKQSSEQAACNSDTARVYHIPRCLSSLQVNQLGPAVKMFSYLGKQGPPKEDREKPDCQSEHTLLQCPELHLLALTLAGTHQECPLYTTPPLNPV